MEKLSTEQLWTSDKPMPFFMTGLVNLKLVDKGEWAICHWEVDLQSMVDRVMGSIQFTANGYWADTVSLGVRRSRTRDEEWVVKLSHSSGGRLDSPDRNYSEEDGFVVVESDLDAECFFAETILFAAKLGREILRRLNEKKVDSGVEVI